MKTIFRSDIPALHGKEFETEEACLAAEKEYEEAHAAELKAKEERKAAAKEVEDAYKKYIELRSEFIKKYGSYHATYTNEDTGMSSLVDLFELMF